MNTQTVTAFRAAPVFVADPLYLVDLQSRGRRGPMGLRDDVVESSSLRDARPSDLLMYLGRRFGPGNWSVDRKKAVVSGWLLTTPHPDVFVMVAPTFGATMLSFSVYTTRASDEGDDRHVTYVAEVRSSYAALIEDLTRPIRKDGFLVTHDGRSYDDEGDNDTAVDPALSVGLSVPTGLMDPPGWGEFCSHLQHMGNGDIVLGRTRFIEQQRRFAFDRLIAMSGCVVALVGGSVRGDDEWIKDAIEEHCAAYDRADILGRMEAFSDFLDGRSDDQEEISGTIRLDVHEEASRWFDSVGMDVRLDQRLAAVRKVISFEKCFHQLRDALQSDGHRVTEVNIDALVPAKHPALMRWVSDWSGSDDLALLCFEYAKKHGLPEARI